MTNIKQWKKKKTKINDVSHRSTRCKVNKTFKRCCSINQVVSQHLGTQFFLFIHSSIKPQFLYLTASLASSYSYSLTVDIQRTQIFSMRKQTERRNVALGSASKIQRCATVTNVAAANGNVNNPQPTIHRVQPEIFPAVDNFIFYMKIWLLIITFKFK